MLKWIAIVFLFNCSLYAQTLTHSAYFDFDASRLNSSEEETLAKFLQVTDTLTITGITIQAYCDDRGSEEYNITLSQERANAVAGYIKAKPSLKTDGMGKVLLKNPPDTVAQRKQNRRADVIITYTVPNPEEIIVKEILEPVKEKETQPIFTGTYKKITDILERGDKLLLNNLLFIGSKSVLRKRSEKDLNKLLVYLKQNPNIRFEVQGHVCCIYSFQEDAIDTDSDTADLSVRRAKRVYDYLLQNGIAAERMTYKGYGRQFPIEGGRESDNKRVEILITDIK